MGKRLQHNIPDDPVDKAMDIANNSILNTADEFLKTYDIDSNGISINTLKDVLDNNNVDLEQEEYAANNTIRLFSMIQKLTKAQEAVRLAELERTKAYEEYNSTNKQLIDIENDKLHNLEDILSTLNKIVSSKSIETALNKLITNQVAAYTQIVKLITTIDTLVKVMQISIKSEKLNYALEEESRKLQNSLKEYAMPHLSVNVPINTPVQHNINGDVYSERDINL